MKPDKDRRDHEGRRGIKTGKQILNKSVSRKIFKENDKEFDKAFREMYSGTDRVAAIMGAALVEHYLMDTIETSLADPSDEHDLFHDSGAPFGTFKARITAAKAMGLFSKEIAIQINLVREIRNVFAHQILSMDFNHSAVKVFLDKINTYNVDDDEERMKKIGVGRWKYEQLIWSLCLMLGEKILNIQQVKIKELKDELSGLKGAPSTFMANMFSQAPYVNALSESGRSVRDEN